MPIIVTSATKDGEDSLARVGSGMGWLLMYQPPRASTPGMLSILTPGGRLLTEFPVNTLRKSGAQAFHFGPILDDSDHLGEGQFVIENPSAAAALDTLVAQGPPAPGPEFYDGQVRAAKPRVTLPIDLRAWTLNGDVMPRPIVGNWSVMIYPEDPSYGGGGIWFDFLQNGVVRHTVTNITVNRRGNLIAAGDPARSVYLFQVSSPAVAEALLAGDRDTDPYEYVRRLQRAQQQVMPGQRLLTAPLAPQSRPDSSPVVTKMPNSPSGQRKPRETVQAQYDRLCSEVAARLHDESSVGELRDWAKGLRISPLPRNKAGLCIEVGRALVAQQMQEQ